MSEQTPLSRARLVDAVGLQIQDLHADGRLPGNQPLLRIDNRDQARSAPFQFDAARGQLHRTGCRAIPPGSGSALYGVWQVGDNDESVACPRCRPTSAPEDTGQAAPHKEDMSVDLLYGLLSIVSQFGSVLRERGQEYRNSRAGTAVGAQIDKIYSGINEREKTILDTLASSLGAFAVAMRDIEEGITGDRGSGGGTGAAEAPGPARPPGEAQ